MKRLLILGGTSISRQIVYAARELDMEVYVTDYLADSPCKKLADKSFMVSCTDVDAVVDLIKREHIDGIIMGYADVLMPYYVKICEKAGIPCYANLHAIDVTADKAQFKALCKDFDVPIVPEYTLDDIQNGAAQYPVLVKPVDNSGARGIFICHNREEFDAYYPESLSYSPSKHVLIERFITAPEATIFYYLHNGEIFNVGVSDRHMLKFSDKLLQLPVGYTFPSVNRDEFMKEEDKNIKALFRSLGMKDGMVFLQSFNENGKYVIYEMGYRLTGSLEHHLMGQAYGFDHLKEILNFAVGNPVDTAPLKTESLGNAILANVTLLLSEGVIAQYKGFDECRNIPGVLHIHESYDPGTVIDEKIMGKLAQVGIRVLLYADTREQLLQRMDRAKAALGVLSTDGREMLIKNYSYQDICKI
ncbi:MAG: hypothetical protein Q4D14_00570 [Bacteroidales bacterium]|nr:hypothetical protein [Bacteroidales bacterium]